MKRKPKPRSVTVAINRHNVWMIENKVECDGLELVDRFKGGEFRAALRLAEQIASDIKIVARVRGKRL